MTRDILAVLPDVTNTGGVQRICRHAAAVLSDHVAGPDDEVTVLTYADPAGDHEVRVDDAAVQVRGFGSSRSRLTAAALPRLAGADVLVLGHPHLAPLALAPSIGPQRTTVFTYGIDVWDPLGPLRRRGLERADAVTALSTYSAGKLEEVQGVDDERIHLVPPALDPAMVDGRADTPADPPAGPVILTVTRLDASEQYKGVDTTIEAMAALRKEAPDATFVVVGDGDDRPRLEALAEDRGVADAVQFEGARFGDELRGWYEAADVFAMPSKGEGFGIVFLEAMAHGTPPVGGNHAGTRDVIEDDETGYLIDHGDVETLADRLLLLLEDPELRKRMGKAGRRAVEEQYTFEAFRDRLAEVVG